MVIQNKAEVTKFATKYGKANGTGTKLACHS